MWFHYKNPVSGRVPENYWPDCVPCTQCPRDQHEELRLLAAAELEPQQVELLLYVIVECQ